MNNYDIIFLDGNFTVNFPAKLNEAMDVRVSPCELSNVNWPSLFPDKPDVKFRLAYGKDGIYVRYNVSENSILARALSDNGKVWEDSCAELFLDISEEGQYYNLEANCIGTVLLGKGYGRHDRVHVSQDDMGSILRHSSVERKAFEEIKGRFNWELTILVPYRVLGLTGSSDLAGKTIRGNVYKCGDALSSPHYISWNPIGTITPDFHSPDYFGNFRFLR